MTCDDSKMISADRCAVDAKRKAQSARRKAAGGSTTLLPEFTICLPFLYRFYRDLGFKSPAEPGREVDGSVRAWWRHQTKTGPKWQNGSAQFGTGDESKLLVARRTGFRRAPIVTRPQSHCKLVQSSAKWCKSGWTWRQGTLGSVADRRQAAGARRGTGAVGCSV